MARFWIVFFGLLGLCYLPVVPDGGLLPRQFLIAGCALAGYFLLPKGKGVRIDLSLGEGAFLAWLVWQAASVGWAVNEGEAWAVTGRWAVLGGFYLLARQAWASGGLTLSTLAYATLAYLLGDLTVALLQAVPLIEQGELLAKAQRVVGSHGNKNLLAVSLYLSLPALVWASVRAERGQLLFRIAAVLVLVGILILQTRSALVGLSVGALAAGAVWLLEGGQAGWKRLGLTGLGVVLMGGLLFGLTRQGFTEKLANTESIAERLALWRNSVQMWKEAPVVGKGAGQWQIWMPKYGVGHFFSANVQRGQTTFQRPHNDYLWLGTELGLVGLALYLVFFWGGVVRLFRAIRKATDPGERWAGLLGLGTLVGYAALAQFDFPHERPELQVWMLVWLGYGYAKAGMPGRFSVPGLALPGLALLSLGLGLPRLSGEMKIKPLRQATARGNAGGALLAYRLANHPHLLTVDPTTVPLAWHAGVAVFYAGQYGQALELFQEARRVAPYHFLTYNSLGSSYAKLGQIDSAKLYFRKAIAISPNWDEPRINLMAVTFNELDGLDSAFAMLRRMPKTIYDQRFERYEGVVFRKLLLARRETEPLTYRSKIDTLLLDKQYPWKAIRKFEESGRDAFFWRK